MIYNYLKFQLLLTVLLPCNYTLYLEILFRILPFVGNIKIYCKVINYKCFFTCYLIQIYYNHSYNAAYVFYMMAEY